MSDWTVESVWVAIVRIQERAHAISKSEGKEYALGWLQARLDNLVGDLALQGKQDVQADKPALPDAKGIPLGSPEHRSA